MGPPGKSTSHTALVSVSYYNSSSICLCVRSLSPLRSFDGSSPNFVAVCRWTSKLPLRGSFSKRSSGRRVNGSLSLSLYYICARFTPHSCKRRLLLHCNLMGKCLVWSNLVNLLNCLAHLNGKGSAIWAAIMKYSLNLYLTNHDYSLYRNTYWNNFISSRSIQHIQTSKQCLEPPNIQHY